MEVKVDGEERKRRGRRDGPGAVLHAGRSVWPWDGVHAGRCGLCLPS